MATALAAAAASWGVLMALSPVLQIRRILSRRSAADISLGYLAVLIVGFGLWIAYGAAIDNLAIMVPNSIALLVGLTTIAVAARFRASKVAAGAEPDAAGKARASPLELE